MLDGVVLLLTVDAGGVLALALFFETLVVGQVTDGVLDRALDALTRGGRFLGDRIRRRGAGRSSRPDDRDPCGPSVTSSAPAADTAGRYAPSHSNRAAMRRATRSGIWRRFQRLSCRGVAWLPHGLTVRAKTRPRMRSATGRRRPSPARRERGRCARRAARSPATAAAVPHSRADGSRSPSAAFRNDLRDGPDRIGRSSAAQRVEPRQHRRSCAPPAWRTQARDRR